MANNYTLFSVTLGRCTNQECDWLKGQYGELEDSDDGAGFDFSIDAGFPYVFSEDSGDCQRAADFLQKFIKEWRPKQWTALEVAMTCSKPRAGEFGGSVCVITAKKQVWMNTGMWALHQAKKMRLNQKAMI